MIVLAKKYASSASILSKEKIIKLKYDSLLYGFSPWGGGLIYETDGDARRLA